MKRSLVNLQYNTLKRRVVQDNSWHTGAGMEWTGKNSSWPEEGEEAGGGRAEGWSAIGDRASCSVAPTWRWWRRFWSIVGFNPLAPLEELIQWHLDSSFFSRHRWHGSTELHSEQLLQTSWTFLHSGPVSQKRTIFSNKEHPLAISCTMSLFSSSVTSSSPCLSSSFLWTHWHLWKFTAWRFVCRVFPVLS